MNARTKTWLARLLILLGLLLAVLKIWAELDVRNRDRIRALVPVSQDTLWLVFGSEIWVLDARGRRQSTISAAALGISSGIITATAVPQGGVALAAVGSPQLHLVDAAALPTPQVDNTLTLQWPDGELDALRHNTRHLAINVAGDILVSSGMGKHVSLFNADGQFRQLLPAAAVVNTTGIMTAAGGWWRAAANDARLDLLAADDLRVLQSIHLRLSPPSMGRTLAVLKPYGGRMPEAHTGDDPMASLTWFGLPGLSGRLVDVHADGRTAVYAPAQTRNIADFAWFNGELLAADDVLPGILRFNAQRRQLEDFGGPALYAQLRQKLHQFRHTALFGSHWIWVAAMALTLCGLASGIRSMDETSREQLGQLKNVFTLQFPPLPGVTPVTLGTPAPKPRPLGIRMALGIFVEGVLRLGFVLVVIAPEYFMQWAPAGTSSRTMACIAIGLFCSMELFTYLAQTRSKRRFRQRNLLNPEKESELNREGVELARRNANNWLALMQKDGDGERPLESTTLQQGIFSRWLLLTDRRIILYRWRAHITRHTIWQRAEVADASGTDQGVLCIQFHNGERLRGTCPSAVTAARIVKKLGCASSP